MSGVDNTGKILQPVLTEKLLKPTFFFQKQHQISLPLGNVPVFFSFFSNYKWTLTKKEMFLIQARRVANRKKKYISSSIAVT